MPTSNSAKKRLRQNIKRRARNRAAKSELKSLVRKVRESAQEGDAGAAVLREAAKKLDRAAAKRLIHPNAAARTKSRLVKAIKAGKAVAAK